MGSLRIELFNSPFVIKSDEDDEYLQKLLGYYTQIVEKIQNLGVLKSPVQISAFAGIMLCDELYKEKSINSLSSSEKSSPVEEKIQSLFVDKEQSEKAEEIANNLIEKISKVL